MSPVVDIPCDRAHRHGTKGQPKKSAWTMHEIWAGTKARADVETNNRGDYRVTCGDLVKVFRYAGLAISGRGNAFHSATNLAKSLSGFTK